MKTPKKIFIKKSNGDDEFFSRKKLYNSLKRTGLTKKKCGRIVDQVLNKVKAGCNTKEIYKETLRLVKLESSNAAAQYSLKKAIFDLGPAGYHFEKYVAKYFQFKGYKTITSVIVRGKHVKHEVDIIASLDGERTFVECKFHNKSGKKNDLKTALYIKARWDDLKEGRHGENLRKFCFASNTSFTTDALTYAKGVGLDLLGLNAPQAKPFLEEIKEFRLYPITSLTKLSKYNKNQLLDRNIFTIQELKKSPKKLFEIGLTEIDVEIILREVNLLLRG